MIFERVTLLGQSLAVLKEQEKGQEINKTSNTRNATGTF